MLFERRYLDFIFSFKSIFESTLWKREVCFSRACKSELVYGIEYPALGDHWIGLSHFIKVVNLTKRNHRLSLHECYGRSREYRNDIVTQLSELIGCEHKISFSTSDPDIILPVHPPRDGKIIKLSNSEVKPNLKVLAFQFDGLSHPHLNPTNYEVEKFLELFDGWDVIKIGLPLTLKQSFNLLCSSNLFIGVSSGMSHLAASLGIPSFIYFKGGVNSPKGSKIYKHLKRWNPYPQTYFYSSLNELQTIASQLNILKGR